MEMLVQLSEWGGGGNVETISMSTTNPISE